MKYPVLALFVISAIALTHPAYANEEEALPVAHAAALATKPITITSNARNAIKRTNNLKQIADSIGSARQRECKKFTPFDLINNPSAIFKQCQNKTNNYSQRTAEPIEYFKVPRLNNSGVSVTVTKF